jgi:hypothetical protein
MDKNIVALVRNDTKTVGVKFFPDAWTQKAVPESNMSVVNHDELTTLKEYTYVTTLDLALGDLVVVYVGQVPKVVEVVSVHDTLMIQPNHHIQCKWIVTKVDTAYYQNLQAQNAEMQSVLESAYRTNARRQFRDVFLASVDSETAARISAITDPLKAQLAGANS